MKQESDHVIRITMQTNKRLNHTHHFCVWCTIPTSAIIVDPNTEVISIVKATKSQCAVCMVRLTTLLLSCLVIFDVDLRINSLLISQSLHGNLPGEVSVTDGLATEGGCVHDGPPTEGGCVPGWTSY